MHRFEALIDEALFVKRFENIPHRFGVGRVHSLVIVVHVHPTTNTRNDVAPLVGVFHHSLAC